MKKRIAFVNKALWYGGIETALITLLDRLDYEKYDVTLILFHAVFDFDLKERINKNCRLIVIDRSKVATFEKKYKYLKLYHLTEICDNPSWKHKMVLWAVPMLKWLENELYIRYAKKLLKTEQYDTVIAYSDVIGEIAVRAVKAEKYLMFYHHGAMRHVYHEKAAYEKCTKIIAVSENLASILKEFHPKYSDKIIAIHNLTDVKRIRTKALEPIDEVFDSTKFHIVTVGRVSREKGMDIAVRVCARLVEDGFKNIRWWIVGAGPAMAEVKELIRELQMEGYVFAIGRKSNPYPYIQHADLYVQPSRGEAFGLTIMEAMILGRAVVSTCTAGAGNIIENGKTGVLCSVDIDEMAMQIEWLIRDPEQIRKLQNMVQMIDFEEKNRECISRLEALL